MKAKTSVFIDLSAHLSAPGELTRADKLTNPRFFKLTSKFQLDSFELTSKWKMHVFRGKSDHSDS